MYRPCGTGTEAMLVRRGLTDDEIQLSQSSPRVIDGVISSIAKDVSARLERMIGHQHDLLVNVCPLLLDELKQHPSVIDEFRHGR